MSSFNIGLKDGRNVLAFEGTMLNDIIKENNLLNDLPVVLGKINNKIYELGTTITHGGNFEIVDIASRIGMTTYVRTLQFVLIKAISELFPKAKIFIEHSLSKGLLFRPSPIKKLRSLVWAIA